MRYKAVIFDFFGVVSIDVASAWFSKHMPGLPDAEVDAAMAPADRGEITESELMAQLAARVQSDPGRVEHEFKSLVQINSQVVAQIQMLKKNGYKVALCSNASAEFLRPFLAKHQLEQYFDAVVISSEVHCMKPDAAIFEQTLELLEVTAHESIFIDDVSVNVEAAERLGITGIQFTDSATLSADLGTILTTN